MGLGPKLNEGFVNPKPGTCLMLIKEIKFETNENAQTTVRVNSEIVDCFDNPGNIGLQNSEYFGLHFFEKNGKKLWFGVENFLGVIWKATGKKLDVAENYFDAAKKQQNTENQLTGKEYAGDVIEDPGKDKDGNPRVYVKTKRYKDADEYKALKKRYVDNGGEVAADATVEVAAAPAATGDDDW